MNFSGITSTPLSKKTKLVKDHSTEALKFEIKDLHRRLREEKLKKVKFECEIRNRTIDEIKYSGIFNISRNQQDEAELSTFLNTTKNGFKSYIESIAESKNKSKINAADKQIDENMQEDLRKCANERDDIARQLSLREFELLELKMARKSNGNCEPFNKCILRKLETLKTDNSINRVIVQDLVSHVTILKEMLGLKFAKIKDISRKTQLVGENMSIQKIEQEPAPLSDYTDTIEENEQSIDIFSSLVTLPSHKYLGKTSRNESGVMFYTKSDHTTHSNILPRKSIEGTSYGRTTGIGQSCISDRVPISSKNTVFDNSPNKPQISYGNQSCVSFLNNRSPQNVESADMADNDNKIETTPEDFALCETMDLGYSDISSRNPLYHIPGTRTMGLKSCTNEASQTFLEEDIELTGQSPVLGSRLKGCEDVPERGESDHPDNTNLSYKTNAYFVSKPMLPTEESCKARDQSSVVDNYDSAGRSPILASKTPHIARNDPNSSDISSKKAFFENFANKSNSFAGRIVKADVGLSHLTEIPEFGSDSPILSGRTWDIVSMATEMSRIEHLLPNEVEKSHLSTLSVNKGHESTTLANTTQICNPNQSLAETIINETVKSTPGVRMTTFPVYSPHNLTSSTAKDIVRPMDLPSPRNIHDSPVKSPENCISKETILETRINALATAYETLKNRFEEFVIRYENEKKSVYNKQTAAFSLLSPNAGSVHRTSPSIHDKTPNSAKTDIIVRKLKTILPTSLILDSPDDKIPTLKKTPIKSTSGVNQRKSDNLDLLLKEARECALSLSSNMTDPLEEAMVISISPMPIVKYEDMNQRVVDYVDYASNTFEDMPESSTGGGDQNIKNETSGNTISERMMKRKRKCGLSSIMSPYKKRKCKALECDVEVTPPRRLFKLRSNKYSDYIGVSSTDVIKTKKSKRT